MSFNYKICFFLEKNGPIDVDCHVYKMIDFSTYCLLYFIFQFSSLSRGSTLRGGRVRDTRGASGPPAFGAADMYRPSANPFSYV